MPKQNAKTKKQRTTAAKLPPNAELLEPEPPTRKELIMGLTSPMPDSYEDLDDEKKTKVETTLQNLYNGVGLKQACINSGMNDVTFYRYRKRYAWIQEAMDTIVESRLQIVEDALYRSAIGYEYEVKEQSQEQVVDQQGNPTGNVKRHQKLKNVHVAPNPTSLCFYLKNRNSGRWRNDRFITVQSTHTERTEVAVEVEMRKLVAEMSTDDLLALQEINQKLQLKAEGVIDAE